MGHGAHLCYVIGVARVCQHAEIVYRLEDHDQGRCRPLFAASIRNDLRWFLPPDQQTALAHMEVQSHKQARYQEVLSELTGRGLVYACQCSRKTLASTAPPSVGYAATETPYPGTCRDLGIPLETPGCSLRLRLPYTPVFFHDLRHGPLVQFPANQCGDFVLRDRAGHYTYQFTVTIDDLDQGINLIIRGDDLLPSVGRQLLLRRLLGDQTPVWTYHHPLIFDPCTGQKLAKRLQSESWESYRRCGMNADELRGECLFRLGLIPRAVPVTWNDLNRIFFSASMAV